LIGCKSGAVSVNNLAHNRRIGRRRIKMADHKASTALLEIGAENGRVPTLTGPNLNDGIGRTNPEKLQRSRRIAPAIPQRFNALTIVNCFLQSRLSGWIKNWNNGRGSARGGRIGWRSTLGIDRKVGRNRHQKCRSGACPSAISHAPFPPFTTPKRHAHLPVTSLVRTR
jgi:hypothetical protein